MFNLFKNAFVSLITALQGLLSVQTAVVSTPTPVVQEVAVRQEVVVSETSTVSTPIPTPKPTPDVITIVEQLEKLKEEVLATTPEPTSLPLPDLCNNILGQQLELPPGTYRSADNNCYPKPVETPVPTSVSTPVPASTPISIVQKRVFVTPDYKMRLADDEKIFTILMGWNYIDGGEGVGIKCKDQDGATRQPSWISDYVFNGQKFLYSINPLDGTKDTKNILMHAEITVDKGGFISCYAFPYDEPHTSEIITVTN